MLLSSLRAPWKSVAVVLLCGLSFVSNAQLKKNLEYSGFFDSYYKRGPWNVSGGVGLGFYSGDLCGDLKCQTLRPSLSAGGSYKIWPRVVLGADLRFVLLSADDVVAGRGTYKGTNVELATYGRFLIRDEIIRRHSDFNKKKYLFKPYASLGINNLYYWGDLAGEKFQGWTPMPIFGLGAEFRINDHWKILPDLNYRLMLSDKMDGVEGGSSNDSYVTFMVKAEYALFKEKYKKKKLKEEELDRIQRMVDGGSDSTGTKSTNTSSAASDTTGTGATEESTGDDYLNDLLMQSGEPEEEEEVIDDEYYTGEDDEGQEESDTDDEGYYTEDDDGEESSDDTGGESSDDGWDDSGW